MAAPDGNSSPNRAEETEAVANYTNLALQEMMALLPTKKNLQDMAEGIQLTQREDMAERISLRIKVLCTSSYILGLPINLSRRTLKLNLILEYEAPRR